MKLALRIGVFVAAAFVASMLIWQGVAAQGAPDPLRPNTSSTVAFLDIGILVFREGLECILVLAAVTASMYRAQSTLNAAVENKSVVPILRVIPVEASRKLYTVGG